MCFNNRNQMVHFTPHSGSADEVATQVVNQVLFVQNKLSRHSSENLENADLYIALVDMTSFRKISGEKRMGQSINFVACVSGEKI